MPTYLTKKERELQAKQFQVLLRTCHDNLLDLTNERKPDTIAAVLAANPAERNPEKRLALNIRINAQNERIENLLLEIDPRFQ